MSKVGRVDATEAAGDVPAARPCEPRHVQRAGHAARATASGGRLVPEQACPMRNPFQRDRDRIIHSSAFRRLTHKTQVFIYHEGDHYRSRLTHTIEVAQIARALARLLQLDEDLAEAVALAHDLGHPPFGHAGERALASVMTPYGGFDHNEQSLRVVTLLERKYAAFDGLNLAFETLEGIVKHNGPLLSDGDEATEVPRTVLELDARMPLMLAGHATAEAQVAAIADDIAYNNHDLDDGLRAGLIDITQLREIPLTGRFLAEVAATHGELGGQRCIYEVNRRLITAMIFDVAAETRRRAAEHAVETADDVRRLGANLVDFSQALVCELDVLRAFLFANVYRDGRVVAIMRDAEQVVRDLFERYMSEPSALPESWAGLAADADHTARARLICDYVAGMTDRFALQEHRRLFDATPDLR
ncbi:MAG: deoxyguanosinetriphosphate triphosphohydrolase [Rhizobiales bacterium]|nr:deoxyguanosinetriphosphate triphosphohydrolase [Hyphomicrobiales bacterium]